MDELKVELAIDIMQRRIAQFIRNNKEKDLETFKKQLQKLIKEEEEIYKLDDKAIEKAYQVYLKELKKEK